MNTTMELNNWEIENPAWKDARCKWSGFFISNHFLQIGKEPRYFVKWPVLCEHFYTVRWAIIGYDAIFASYSLNEIRKFIKALGYDESSTKVYDEVKHEYVSVGMRGV